MFVLFIRMHKKTVYLLAWLRAVEAMVLLCREGWQLDRTWTLTLNTDKFLHRPQGSLWVTLRFLCYALLREKLEFHHCLGIQN